MVLLESKKEDKIIFGFVGRFFRFLGITLHILRCYVISNQRLGLRKNSYFVSKNKKLKMIKKLSFRINQKLKEKIQKLFQN